MSNGSHRCGGGVAIGIGVGITIVGSWDDSGRGRGHAGKDSDLKNIEFIFGFQGEI